VIKISDLNHEFD